MKKWERGQASRGGWEGTRRGQRHTHQEARALGGDAAQWLWKVWPEKTPAAPGDEQVRASEPLSLRASSCLEAPPFFPQEMVPWAYCRAKRGSGKEKATEDLRGKNGGIVEMKRSSDEELSWYLLLLGQDGLPEKTEQWKQFFEYREILRWNRE